MKRLLPLLAALLLAFSLCGCRGEPNSNRYDVSHAGKTFTVDHEACTITCDGEVYHFTVSGTGSSVSFEVTYPDGSSYHYSESVGGNVGFGQGGWSDDYDPEARGYVPGDVLWDVLGLRAEREKSGPSPLLAVLLLAVGIFNTAAPQTAWWLEYGWRFKDAEPSDLALGANRILGVVLIFIGGVCLLATIF